MKYIGEHLLPGQIGHFFAILFLVSAAVTTIAFFKANRHVHEAEKQSWLRFARIAFLTETLSVLGIFFTLYYITFNHYHEYFYAWNHSSATLQPEYLLASFWEGQEGSFMLWSFWHCIIGWFFIWRTPKWQAPVLTVLNFAQFCIATMLVGFYFAGVKIGSNPFILFREQMQGMPLFENADYLNFPTIKQGQDLNTLLQNYWMVIHPPVLFLGFSSTIIPFGFAYAGLINKDHTWTKAALSWSCFSAAVLGTGIMMGGAWAYESLTFGGYWAWDPVENASLVPWLLLIAGLHTNLVYNHSGYSLRSTYVFYILSFTLVLYSTFLTRSGILGDTSVHAFTGADMTLQLLLFMAALFVPVIALYFIRRRNIPSIRKEENTYSREFWMFIGALVLMLSSAIITAKTSLPVFNKIFGTSIAPPADPEFSHNQVQVFIAIIIGILTAVTQYLKYKQTPKAQFTKNLLWPTVASLIVSVCISIFGDIDYNKHGIGFLAAIHIGIFSSVYAVIANAMYIFTAKGNMKAAGASIAHVGFGLFLTGVLLSSSKKEVLSMNTTGLAVFEKTKDQDPAENITLFRGVRTDMGAYHVTYTRDTSNDFDRKRYFELKFENKNNNESFYLYPDVLRNNKGNEGFSANPDKKHYLFSDIYAYVTTWVDVNREEDTSSFRMVQMKAGDTSFYSNGMLILNKIAVNPPDNKRVLQQGEDAVMLDIKVLSKAGKQFNIQPGFAYNQSTGAYRILMDTVYTESLVLQLTKLIDETKGVFEIGIKEDSNMLDLMTLKVYKFPFIGLVWLGIIITVAGLLISMRQRIKMMRRKNTKEILSSSAEV